MQSTSARRAIRARRSKFNSSEKDNKRILVDFNDIPAFVDALLMSIFQAEADVDQNGLVDFNDIPVFVAILLG